MLKQLAHGAIATALVVLSPTVFAVPILTTGSGSAVTTADHSATFDTLTAFGLDLNTYTEDGLDVRSVSPSNYGLSFFCEGCFANTTGGVWYVNAGGMYDGYLSISTVSGQAMQGAEFVFGNGWATPVWLYWETYTGTTLTGSGQLSSVNAGLTLGFGDVAGFDELRLGAYNVNPNGTFIGAGPNAIAIDNLRVQTLSTSVPEPGTWGLLLSMLPLVLLARRRRQCA